MFGPAVGGLLLAPATRPLVPWPSAALMMAALQRSALDRHRASVLGIADSAIVSAS